MCDALKRNEPAEHPTELCHCLVHARRQFVEIRASFPEECRRVVQGLAEIYKVEAECRREELDPGQRLRRHQERSAPMLEKLRRQFQEEVESRKIEPNSGLGGAVGYLLNRWDTLTKFLKVPGAPLDNNETERLLKAAILHRKNSLHYKTQRGADVGDTFMTVIETCRANGVDPFEYMLAVVKNAEAARRDPGKWSVRAPGQRDRARGEFPICRKFVRCPPWAHRPVRVFCPRASSLPRRPLWC
jgi:hypothetical protein